MKKVLFSIMILAGTQALANMIELAPGSSATIIAGETTLVKCQGSTVNSCDLRQVSYSSSWIIYRNGTQVSPSLDYSEAIVTLKKLREAGFCN